MFKRILFLLLGVIMTGSAIQAQTVIVGSVKEKDGGDPVLFANIAVKKGDNLVTGGQTDFDGNYRISNIDPGTYDIEASYVGMQTQKVTGVVVINNKITRVNFNLAAEGVMLKAAEVISYKVPLIDKGSPESGQTITGEAIANLPNRGINAIAATTAGIASQDGGKINIKGSRDAQTVYFLDGIRVTDASLIPSSEIDQLQVLTGGLGAEYGDLTGGAISLTSKGPSPKFSGGMEMETSQYLDAFGASLISGNLSGPVWKKNGKSIIGFRVSGQYRYRLDDDPPAGGIYVADEDKIKELQKDPLFKRNGVLLAKGEFLSEGQGVSHMDYRPNEQRKNLDLTGKLDFQLTPAIDLMLSGTYGDMYNRFQPGTVGSDSRFNSYRGAGSWRLLNWVNNPENFDNVYRLNARFRHKIGSVYTGAEATDEEKSKKASVISNASYTIQGGYERRQRKWQDINHKDNYFDYGYVGKLDRQWDTIAAGGQHFGYAERLKGYTPGGVNPIWEAYNQYIEKTPNQYTDYVAYNGELNPLYNTIWNVYSNVSGVYDRNQKTDFERYSANLKVQFDLTPFGSKAGTHNIVIGGQYEQRIERFWRISPSQLWRTARQLANAHIGSLDTNHIVTILPDGTPIFGNKIQIDKSNKFNEEVRKLMFPGASLYGDDQNGTMYNFVNTDALSPDQLSLEMFSPRELSDNRVVYFYGYDYLGKKVANNATFADFFKRDADGRQTFTVAPYKPIYSALYLQDRFNINDIIFKFGVRVDYFDANQKVLKDKYSLYPIMSAADFYSDPDNGTRPDGVGENFKVYTEGSESNKVLGFRDGDTWYDAGGRQLNSGRQLFGDGGLVTPKFAGQDTVYNLESAAFNPDLAFEDYKPQINVMPRLGFSFPISDDANFYAHYDVLVSRPYTGNIATAYDYYYWTDPNRTTISNPNLKPEKTVDYEVGFQQKVSNTSAIKLSMYYREFRDQIQRRNLLFTAPEPISSYQLYDNIDFGTSKGFTIQYDLRRTGNVMMNISYTLGFAEGTGSDENSQRDLISRGFNIRTLSPLSYDERHRIAATFDYRYRSGKYYNGPSLMGYPLFENTGLNLQAISVTGRPYTKRRFASKFGGQGIDGQINGARLPSNFNIDMKIDRRMKLFKGENRKGLNVTVYLRVNNLLDTRNVISVYSASGSPTDDGYFQSIQGQQVLRNVRSTRPDDFDNYIEIYNWRKYNPNHFTLPRRIFLGAIVNL